MFILIIYANFNKMVQVLWLNTWIIFIYEIWQEHHKVWERTILMNSFSMTQTLTTKFFDWPLLKTHKKWHSKNNPQTKPLIWSSLCLDKPFHSRRPNHSQPKHAVAPRSHHTHTRTHTNVQCSLGLWSFAFLPVKCPVFPWHTCTGALWSCCSNNLVH